MGLSIMVPLATSSIRPAVITTVSALADTDDIKATTAKAMRFIENLPCLPFR
jgi:hypothetical protein